MSFLDRFSSDDDLENEYNNNYNKCNNNYWPKDDVWRQWNAKRDEDGIISLTYDSLYYITYQTCSSFLSTLQSNAPPQHEQQRQPIVAISIPEGPYLPLAVLALHILSVSTAITSDDSTSDENYNGHTYKPIMMPLDPEEGIDRLEHMIKDAQPDFILSVEGAHMERIEKVISSTYAKQYNNSLQTTASKPISRVQVLDFSVMVREALQYTPDNSDNNNKNSAHLRLKFHPDVKTILSQFHDTKMLLDYNRSFEKNIISHIVYTSGTTGVPKGCISSLSSLLNYIPAKDHAHGIMTHYSMKEDIDIDRHDASNLNTSFTHSTSPLPSKQKRIFLASALPFDPCLSDILATFYAHSTLLISTKSLMQTNLKDVLYALRATHILCTPTLWNTIPISNHANVMDFLPCLEVIALGGEPIPKRILSIWARRRIKRKMEKSQEQKLQPAEISIKSKTCIDKNDAVVAIEGRIKLLATYGVTEACVYQTAGEVFFDMNDDNVSSEHTHDKHSNRLNHPPIGLGGQDVGTAFIGSMFQIFPENPQQQSSSLNYCETNIGEIVISGIQVDALSGYLNRPQLTKEKFIHTNMPATESDHVESNSMFDGVKHLYRTGDRGYINPQSGHLHILGRIDGEEGMIKVNGIRVELGEIEAGIVDDVSRLPSPSASGEPIQFSIVEGVIVTAKSKDDEGSKTISAYIVLSETCRNEIGISLQKKVEEQEEEPTYVEGVLCPPSPLLTLLHARCYDRVRKGCVPSVFILIDGIPLTPTGKCNRKSLPPLQVCKSAAFNDKSILLQDYGGAGLAVATELIHCLNLQDCQKSMVTTDVTFAVLGGESLAATRITRSLYASHRGIFNSRHLGGSKGTLDGPFNVTHLLRASTLGDYIDFLDSYGVCQRDERQIQHNSIGKDSNQTEFFTDAPVKENITLNVKNQDETSFDALMEAIALGQTTVALGLLALGVDPNSRDHGKRIGKTKDRNERRQAFRSNPLHLACINGNSILVQALIQHGCKCNSPDANGSFPIHLACIGNRNVKLEAYSMQNKRKKLSKSQRSHSHDADPSLMQDLQRTKCVQYLLQSGKVPLTMKDSSKQTVLHTAARSGYCKLLIFLLNAWSKDETIKEVKAWGTKFDCQDRWFRTPVHWAVLNGNVEALEILIKGGCSAKPLKPKKGVSNRATSVAIESPIEICERLYGKEEGLGKIIHDILVKA